MFPEVYKENPHAALEKQLEQIKYDNLQLRKAIEFREKLYKLEQLEKENSELRKAISEIVKQIVGMLDDSADHSDYEWRCGMSILLSGMGEVYL